MAGDGRRTRKVNILYGVFRQISELSVDVESKQKELQRLQQDKSGVEEQLSSLVRRCQSLFEQHKKKEEQTKKMTRRLSNSHLICHVSVKLLG